MPDEKLPSNNPFQAKGQHSCQGRQEGIKKGIEKGEYIGVIRTCQSILKELESSEADLRSKSIEELRTMADDLRGLLRTRFEAK